MVSWRALEAAPGQSVGMLEASAKREEGKTYLASSRPEA
jgi:hypothetical protein